MSYGILIYRIRKKIAEMSRTNDFARWCYQVISLSGFLEEFPDEVPPFVYYIVAGIRHPEYACELQCSLYRYFGGIFEDLFKDFDMDLPFWEGTGMEAQYKTTPVVVMNGESVVL